MIRRQKTPPADLAEQIAALPDLPSPDLKSRWEELYGRPPPPRIGRLFLVRSIAYRLQDNAYGGLKPALKKKLDRAWQEIEAGRPVSASVPAAKPGTRLIREWQGVTHEVILQEKGVEYRGEVWSSLSAVAREITGARWSGPRFFGLHG